ncbi:MAG TPA: FAD binding domain-containing protein, partial [Chitinophagaceae bacterium]|nr:FAD binding domain-containing protein [Chitinophagaceae bacterium]
MINFEYTRSSTVRSAIESLAKNPTGSFIAGGTNLVDLMKRGVTAPTRLIDINALPLKQIGDSTAGLHIGGLVTNSDLADHESVKTYYPLL